MTKDELKQMYFFSQTLGIQPSEYKAMTRYERQWFSEKYHTDQALAAAKAEKLRKTTTKGNILPFPVED